MRLSKHHRASDTGFNMTPMIDIVFLLIIFFMTVSQITRVADHPVDLPSVVEGGEATEPIAVTINIDKQGKLIISEKEYSMPQLLVFLGTELNKVNNNPANMKIRLRCDRLCEGVHVNSLVRELTQMRISQVRVAIRGER